MQQQQLAWAFLGLGLVHLVASLDSNVHILYLTDCRPYSDWQAAGMAFAYKNSGQKGKITRVMCCTEEEKEKYNKDLLGIMDSHVAPSFAFHKETNDHYAPFNKPGAVLDFMQHGVAAADWMLVIDSDMQLRHSFDPNAYPGLAEGHAVSADYRYMIGCSNDLAVRHIPEIDPRNDTLAGPLHRRCDMVGGWVFMKKSDLERVAPLWLSYTVDVREDPMAWNLTGDQYVVKGGKAWISEMYGYGFACAKANVWHTWDTGLMHYPTYKPDLQAAPKLTHYGLKFEVGNWSFDKHNHYDLDVTKCPPWDVHPASQPKAGIFQHPPRVSELNKDDRALYYGNLMSIETLETLNAGICDFALSRCPADLHLVFTCTEVLKRYVEVKWAIKEVEESWIGCFDSDDRCGEWKRAGECERNPGFMLSECKKKCGGCTEKDAEKVQIRADAEGKYHGQELDPTKMPGVIELHAKIVNMSETLFGKRGSEREVYLLESLRPPVGGTQSPKEDEEDRPSMADYMMNKPMEQKGLQTKHQNAKVTCLRLSLPKKEVAACLKAVAEGRTYVAPPMSHANKQVGSQGAQHVDHTQSALQMPADSLSNDGNMVSEDMLRVRHGDSVQQWGVTHFWVLLVVAALALGYRLWHKRIRRRPKPSMRTE